MLVVRRVRISVAHNLANRTAANLRALCNRCHVLHDGLHHAFEAGRTRDGKRGQLNTGFTA